MECTPGITGKDYVNTENTENVSENCTHQRRHWIFDAILAKVDGSLKGRTDRTWAHCWAIMSPQDHLTPHPQEFSPIPSKNLCPQTHHWRGGCQQAPGGRWLSNIPGTGIRKEIETLAMPGRGWKGSSGHSQGWSWGRSKVLESGFGSHLLHPSLFC